MIVMMLGGRNAEKLVFGVVSSGAGDDLQKATTLARRMVSEWGMSERIGPMAFGGSGPVFLGDDMMQSKEYSEDVARLIDEETQRILNDQETRCQSLLTANRNALNLVARNLLEHETLSGAEVNRLIAVANGETPPPPPEQAQPLPVATEGAVEANGDHLDVPTARLSPESRT
jgi:cell division protease FtsH